jgi:hypothetical protein
MTLTLPVHLVFMSVAAPQLAAQHVEQKPSSSSSSSTACCGLVAADMGQGLPLRPASLDGAISISALQWIIETAQQQPASQKQQSDKQQELSGSTLWPAQLAAASSSSSSTCCRQVKLLAFFSSLAAVLVPGGAAVAQFYPRDPDEAQVGGIYLLCNNSVWLDS